MAVKAPTYQYTGAGEHTVVVTWTSVTEADTFGPIGPRWADYVDRCVEIVGTIGAATVVLNGSNDGTNYANLTDPQGTAISKTVLPALEQIVENTLYVQPAHSGGTGESINVILVMRRGRGGMEV
jgi:hypothetical protein